MILHALDALYGRLENDPDYKLPSARDSLQKITFKVVLTRQGRLFEIQDARELVEGTPRPKQVLVPGGAKPPGTTLTPCLLWDNSGYMLGYKDQDKEKDEDSRKRQRTAQAFLAFRKKHLALEAEVDSPAFSAVCRFLEGWDPGSARDHPVLADAGKTGFGVFQIQGETRYIHEDPAVCRWWAAHPPGGLEAARGQCLVTGAEEPLARLHPKIKGVFRSRPGGAAIVSFNEDAYLSYGKEQSYNAPVSEDVSFRYSSALNALLDGPMCLKHRLTVGGTTIAFWTEAPTPTEDIFVQFILNGSDVVDDPLLQDEGVRQKLLGFLTALREGGQAYTNLEADPNRTAFFMLGLAAPTEARIAVRFFQRGTLGELLDNLRRHHHDIAMARQPAGGKRPADPEFPPAWLLLQQTARETKNVPSILSGPLLHAIITGIRYPEGLYAAVMRRIRADSVVNYPRACLIKGYLNRNLNKEVSMSLDSSRADPAYRLGRLFATLEKTQQDALGGNLNKTIRDSFYSSASATPGSVFPRLLRTYQHHIAKLEGGRRVNREKLIQEILDPLGTFPTHLGLPDQGLFAIGYYHQTRDFYAKRGDTEQS